MRRRIGKGIDDLQLLDDRARPSMRDDERQRILMFRTNVDEMNVQPVDLRGELRQGVQFSLDLAPIVIGGPIACELLNHCKLHALRLICDGLPFGPLRRGDAPAEINQCRLWNVDVVERTNCNVAFSRLRHLLCNQAEGTRGCRGGKNVSSCCR